MLITQSPLCHGALERGARAVAPHASRRATQRRVRAFAAAAGIKTANASRPPILRVVLVIKCCCGLVSPLLLGEQLQPLLLPLTDQCEESPTSGIRYP